MTVNSAAKLFGDVALAPRDPILGVTDAFNTDPNPRKVNLGVGVYINDEGKVPLLECVKRAERAVNCCSVRCTHSSSGTLPSSFT